VEATEPLEGVSETDEPKPEPLLVETSNPVGAVTVTSAVKFEPVTENVCAVEAVPAVVVKPDKVETEGFTLGDEEAPAGVTLAHVVPTRISSMSAFGVLPAFLRAIDANVVAVAAFPELLLVPPVGSVAPSVGLTQIVAMSLAVLLKSYFTTTKYVWPKTKSVGTSVYVGVPPVVLEMPSLKFAAVLTDFIETLPKRVVFAAPDVFPNETK
jgi:hypothetical protein